MSKILVSGGGTSVPIDRVRSITNKGGGLFAHSIVSALKDCGTDALMSKNWARHNDFDGNKLIIFDTYQDYYEAVKQHIKKYKLFISCAAVSDYAPIDLDISKMDSNEDQVLKLMRLPKILKLVREEWHPDIKIIGFKLLYNPSAETKNNKINSMFDYCDVVIYNDFYEMKQTGKHNISIYTQPNICSFFGCINKQQEIRNVALSLLS